MKKQPQAAVSPGCFYGMNKMILINRSKLEVLKTYLAFARCKQGGKHTLEFV